MLVKLRRRALLLTLVLVGTGCGSPLPTPVQESDPTPAASSPWFKDVTDEIGLHFDHDAGPTGSFYMPQTVGSGAALFDFDNDGRLDLYLIQNGGPASKAKNRLFRQSVDGQFHDVGAGSGLDVAGQGMGVACGDVNNDGWTDVLVTELGRVRLFLNNGNGRFRDVTKAAGLDNPGWGTSAAFVDYDRDGWLDLVVVNYVEFSPTNRCSDYNGTPEYCGPAAFPGSVTRLFHNKGATFRSVRFEDVTVPSGLARQAGPGLGVYCADFNGDRWQDIFVTNDGKPNHLWINGRDGTFKEEAIERGLAFNRMGLAEANMGIALGDVDGDLLFDVFVTHLTEENNTLWKQGPPGSFQDRTPGSDVLRSFYRGTGFGAAFADFDHDGALDMALVNGRVRRAKGAVRVPVEAESLGPFWAAYGERNQLFAGDGHGKFRDRSTANEPLCNTYNVGRGLVCGDIDGDGALDLAVTSVAGRARVFRNVAADRGHWLMVRAFDPRLKRDAYGAEVTVRAGGRSWKAWLNPAYSYLCSNDPRAHFGLSAVDRIESIDVAWPDGSDERFSAAQVDRVVTLRRGDGTPIPPANDPVSPRGK